MKKLQSPPDFIRLLASDLRWTLACALTNSDRRVSELVMEVEQPVNLVSYHLKKMRDEGLVSARRSESDGRDVYYSLNLDFLRDLYRAAGSALHPALMNAAAAAVYAPYRVLFVCTHNSARSQMAEGLLRHLSAGQITVASAGSQPTRLHPEAIRAMDSIGIDIRNQHPQHLSAVEGQAFDVVITVCDRAREVCPMFPGSGTMLHWGFTDPAAVIDPDERAYAFEQTAVRLHARIQHFLSTMQQPYAKGAV